MAEQDLQGRIADLERIARGLSPEQILSFVAAVSDARPLDAWPADERFWYSGTAGIKLTDAEERARDALWTRMLAGLSFAVNGEEVEAWVARPTVMGRLDRLFEPRQGRRIEGRATTVLERTLGGEVWRGVIGIWNAFCAAMLRERLDPVLRSDLESVWRNVIGSRLEL